MSADPNITSNVNRRARGDSHPSLTPLNGPDRRLPRITSGSTRHAATRSGRVASASTSGSSANTDDRVNASGVLATSPVDVRMHAPTKRHCSSSGWSFSSRRGRQIFRLDFCQWHWGGPPSGVDAFPIRRRDGRCASSIPEHQRVRLPDMEDVMDAVQLVLPLIVQVGSVNGQTAGTSGQPAGELWLCLGATCRC